MAATRVESILDWKAATVIETLVLRESQARAEADRLRALLEDTRSGFITGSGPALRWEAERDAAMEDTDDDRN